MNKREVFLPYMMLEPNHHLKRSLDNLGDIKNKFKEIIDGGRDDELLSIISTIIASWTNKFNHLFHSTITFSTEIGENSFQYNISTNLPDIKNEVFLKAKITNGEVKEFSNLRLFSVSHSDAVAVFTDKLYDDGFTYFALPLIWSVRFIIARKSIELSKTINEDFISFSYYLPDNKASIDLYFDINQLDKVRDRWYYLLTKEEDFVILEEE